MHRSEGWHFRVAVAKRNKIASLRSDCEMTLKIRLDKLLVERGLAASRERAQALILAGKVLVNDQKLEKAGAQAPADATVRLLGEDLRQHKVR